MLSGQDLICLSITPWETHLPSSGHFLMREFARSNRVLFVDRPLTLKDLWVQRHQGEARGRIRRTLGLAPRLRLMPDEQRELWVLTPPPMTPNGLPAALYDVALAASALGVRHYLRQALARLEMRQPILWINFEVNLGALLAGTLGERLVVYHCFDEVAGEPYIAQHGIRLEAKLLSKSDVVLASSTELDRSRRQVHPHCHYVPNGVDFAHFSRALDAATVVPPDLARLPHPLIGYLGNFESRVDYDLLEAVARQHPEWNMALIGPSKGEFHERLAQLGRLPNVHVLGPCQAEQGPAYLKGLDVALIPFVRSLQTRAIYPLKINEYLAAGKPVVMTPFAELPEFEAVCWIADGATSFGEAIARALTERSAQDACQRIALASRNAWHERAESISSLLEPWLIAGRPRAVEEAR